MCTNERENTDLEAIIIKTCLLSELRNYAHMR